MSSKAKSTSSTATSNPAYTALLTRLNSILSSHAATHQTMQQQQTQLSYAQSVELLSKQLRELEEPLNDLKKLQAQHASHQHIQQAELNQLAAWLKAESPQCLIGTHWEFEPIASDEEGTGVRAARALKKGELFMNVSRKVMMTAEGLAKSSPLGKVLASDSLCQRLPSLLLACCLLYERSIGAKSYWADYIRCLPKHLNLPMLWSVDEIHSLLQSSPTIIEVLTTRQSIIRQFVHIANLVQNNSDTLKKSGVDLNAFDFTWVGFQWTVGIVMSRQNRIPKLNSNSQAKTIATAADAHTIALIPGWDMCNHRGHGEVATFYVTESDESQSHTMEDVASGAPIYLYYGPRSNAQLMLYAGFVDSTHLNDAMAVVLTTASPSGAAADESLKKIKMMLLKKANMSDSFSLVLPLHEPSALGLSSSSSSSSADAAQQQESRQQARLQWNALMHFLRVSALSTKDQCGLALKYKPSSGTPMSSSYYFLTEPLYPEHDLQAYTFLHDALVAYEQSYGTMIESDEALLVKDEVRHEAAEHVPADAESQRHHHHHLLAKKQRLAIEMRRSEKKLLKQAIAYALELKNKEHTKVEAATKK